MTENNKKETITVAGITFSSEDVKSAVIMKDGREIVIGEKEDTRFGFGKKD